MQLSKYVQIHLERYQNNIIIIAKINGKEYELWLRLKGII